MGCCMSCFKSQGEQPKATEMTATQGEGEKSMKISRKMTAPTIKVEGGLKVKGSGLALAGVAIEQDAAYWEWHVEIPDGSSQEIMFGVATKKDRGFYKAQKEADIDGPSETNGTNLMKKVKVKNDDTVGVACQHSDLPMVQFLLNGEPLHELGINRFRGQVYPSIYLPLGETSGLQVKLVLNEDEFKQMSPHARFGPVIVARGII